VQKAGQAPCYVLKHNFLKPLLNLLNINMTAPRSPNFLELYKKVLAVIENNSTDDQQKQLPLALNHCTSATIDYSNSDEEYTYPQHTQKTRVHKTCLTPPLIIEVSDRSCIYVSVYRFSITSSYDFSTEFWKASGSCFCWSSVELFSITVSTFLYNSKKLWTLAYYLRI
jgi:hypothetical protein